MIKTKPKFIYFLSAVSILGFLATGLNNLNIVNIDVVVSNTIFIILGLGLMFEAGALKILTNNNFDENIPKLITLIVGFAVFLTGVISFFNVTWLIFSTFKAIASFIAIAVIFMELFVVD